MIAHIFPGQGSQFSGMGKALYDSHQEAKDLFHKADKILGFKISSIMFEGSAEDLKQTKVTQPSIFIHSIVAYMVQAFNKHPSAVAGHSLGEVSALVASQCLSFDEGLEIVKVRALAMQEACEIEASTMAAVLGMDANSIKDICEAEKELVVVANDNCKGQVVISGSIKGVENASAKLKDAGAKRVVPLPVGGAFHSPLMQPALKAFEEFVHKISFKNPNCNIFQNVDANPHKDGETIKANLIKQLVSPVLWTQTVLNMQKNGITHFIEIGPGKVLQGLVKKTFPEATTEGIN